MGVQVGDVHGKQGNFTFQGVGSSLPGWPDPQILYGDNPIWTDEDDATYAEIHRIHRPGAWIGSNFAWAPVLRTGPAAPISSIEWEARISADRLNTVGQVGVELEFFKPLGVESFEKYFTFTVTENVPVDGGIHTYSGTITEETIGGTWEELTFADVAAAIDGGEYMIWASVSGSPPEPDDLEHHLIARIHKLTLSTEVIVVPLPAAAIAGGLDYSRRAFKQRRPW